MNGVYRIIGGLTVAFAAAIAVLITLPAAIETYAWAGWSGRYFIVAYIGFLGGIGGLLSAARDGVLHLPQFDANGDLKLGMVQEVAFGFVGGIVVFLIIPSMSDKAVEMGNAAVKEAILHSLPRPAADSTASVKIPEVEWPKDLDWIELIALSLVGGYGGRALIAKALHGLSREEVDASIKHQAEEIERQYRNDQEAWNVVADQADVYTNPPPVAKVQAALKAASDVARRQAYVQTRSQCHLYLMTAAQLSDAAARDELIMKVANRVLPIMEILGALDSRREFRGSRFLASLCKFLLSDRQASTALLDDAMAISAELKKPPPKQYELLREALEGRRGRDVDFLVELVRSTDEN